MGTVHTRKSANTLSTAPFTESTELTPVPDDYPMDDHDVQISTMEASTAPFTESSVQPSPESQVNYPNDSRNGINDGSNSRHNIPVPPFSSKTNSQSPSQNDSSPNNGYYQGHHHRVVTQESDMQIVD